MKACLIYEWKEISMIEYFFFKARLLKLHFTMEFHLQGYLNVKIPVGGFRLKNVICF